MIEVLPIPAFNDNYIWLIKNLATNHCILIDPGDARPCIEKLNTEGLILDAVLITHHHADHIGGVKELQQYAAEHDSQLAVYGPPSLKPHVVTDTVNDGDALTFWQAITLEVIAVPGHTLDHIAFYGNNWLFCGDTMFSAGCGRLFEGSPEQMYHSLQRLSALAPTTKVFCAHEYTSANIKFALTVEPDNETLHRVAQQISRKRQHNQPSLPTTIAKEQSINPFLRCQHLLLYQPAFKSMRSPVDVFTKIRQLKDNF